MKTLGTSAAFAVIAAIIVAAIFLGLSFLVMLLTNVILNQYGAEALEYRSAMAATLLIIMITSMCRQAKDNK